MSASSQVSKGGVTTLTLKDATKRYTNLQSVVTSSSHSRHASSAQFPAPKLNVVSRGGTQNQKSKDLQMNKQTSLDPSISQAALQTQTLNHNSSINQGKGKGSANSQTQNSPLIIKQQSRSNISSNSQNSLNSQAVISLKGRNPSQNSSSHQSQGANSTAQSSLNLQNQNTVYTTEENCSQQITDIPSKLLKLPSNGHGPSSYNLQTKSVESSSSQLCENNLKTTNVLFSTTQFPMSSTLDTSKSKFSSETMKMLLFSQEHDNLKRATSNDYDFIKSRERQSQLSFVSENQQFNPSAIQNEEDQEKFTNSNQITVQNREEAQNQNLNEQSSSSQKAHSIIDNNAYASNSSTCNNQSMMINTSVIRRQSAARGGTSSQKTSAPSTCIKVSQNKPSQYRYGGSPNNEFDDEEEENQNQRQEYTISKSSNAEDDSHILNHNKQIVQTSSNSKSTSVIHNSLQNRYADQSSLLERSKNRFNTSNNDISDIEGGRLRNPQFNNSTLDQLEYSNNFGCGSESEELNIQALQNNLNSQYENGFADDQQQAAHQDYSKCFDLMPQFTNDSQNAINSYPDCTYEEEDEDEPSNQNRHQKENCHQNNYKYTSNSDEYVQHNQPTHHYGQYMQSPVSHLTLNQAQSNTNSNEVLPLHNKKMMYMNVYSSQQNHCEDDEYEERRQVSDYQNIEGKEDILFMDSNHAPEEQSQEFDLLREQQNQMLKSKYGSNSSAVQLISSGHQSSSHPQFFSQGQRNIGKLPLPYVQYTIEEQSETSSHQQMDSAYNSNIKDDLRSKQQLTMSTNRSNRNQPQFDMPLQGQQSSNGRIQTNQFQYVMKNIEMNQSMSRQQIVGNQAELEEEAFLFDSLNSFQPNNINCDNQPRSNKNQNGLFSDISQQNTSVLSSQMQLTLKQAVASFAQEKQMLSRMSDLQKSNKKLKEENKALKQTVEAKDSEIEELRIQLKEFEIRLSHAEGQLKKERQDKESNALAFKRILSNITSTNKENSNPSLVVSYGNGLPTSQKKMNQRKLSNQFEMHSSIGNQSQFKFLMGGENQNNLNTQGTIQGGPLMSKTLEHESTLGVGEQHSTLDQISRLKNQLTYKEEELKNLRKQHRRAGNQSVWWFNNRGQHTSKNYFNQSGSAGYSPLPTQPSMPSNYNNPLIESNNRGSSKKPQKAYQQQFQMLSPMQGSPILSNNGSVNSWIKSKSQRQQQSQNVGQFNYINRDDDNYLQQQHSQTEIPLEASFDQVQIENTYSKSHHPQNPLFPLKKNSGPSTQQLISKQINEENFFDKKISKTTRTQAYQNSVNYYSHNHSQSHSQTHSNFHSQSHSQAHSQSNHTSASLVQSKNMQGPIGLLASQNMSTAYSNNSRTRQNQRSKAREHSLSQHPKKYEIEFTDVDEDLKQQIEDDNDLDNLKEAEGNESEDQKNANELGLLCKNEQKKLEMMISGGDYSPNSHTFFKQPFTKDQQSNQNSLADLVKEQKLVVLNKCPKQGTQKNEKQPSHSRKASYSQHRPQVQPISKQESCSLTDDQRGKSSTFYGSILLQKTKLQQQATIPNHSPMEMLSKRVESKQQSRKNSPIGGGYSSLRIGSTADNMHSTLDNSDLSSHQQKQLVFSYGSRKQSNVGVTSNQICPSPLPEQPIASVMDERISMGLGPHNTMGTTIVTNTSTTTTNISPLKQGKRLIPDSLVKQPLKTQGGTHQLSNQASSHSIFTQYQTSSAQQHQYNTISVVKTQKPLNVAKYQSVKR